MTTIKIYRNNSNDIVKFIIDGHSEYSDKNDIVCAALSSVSFMVLNGIEKLTDVKFGYEKDDGYLMFVLNESCEGNKEVNILLSSMYLFFKELEEQNPDNIRIIEPEV